MEVLRYSSPYTCHNCLKPFHALVLVHEYDLGLGEELCSECARERAASILKLATDAAIEHRSHGIDWE